MIVWILVSAAGDAIRARRRHTAAGRRGHRSDSPLLGLRFQLLRTLEQLDRGRLAVLGIESGRRAGDGKSGESADPACEAEKVSAARLLALVVPGTMYPAPVGRALLKFGWIKPSARRHWVPLLRFFEISDSGRLNLLQARKWWSELGPLEKLAAMVAE